MNVTFKLAPYLRKYADNKETVSVKGNTVRECLDNLIRQYPKLKEMIFGEAGVMHNYLSVFAGGIIVFADQLNKQVTEGETIHLLYIIGGG